MSKDYYVKETARIGKGLFVGKNFAKDEFILFIEGKVVETNDHSSFPQEVQDHWFPFDRNKYVLPQAPWMYLNHSCDPNAGIKNNREIVAMRSIKKGEEITIDYAMNSNDEWTMECNCGSPKCRKLIGHFNMLDEETKLRYLDYVCDFLREDYLKSRP